MFNTVFPGVVRTAPDIWQIPRECCGPDAWKYMRLLVSLGFREYALSERDLKSWLRYILTMDIKQYNSFTKFKSSAFILY